MVFKVETIAFRFSPTHTSNSRRLDVPKPYEKHLFCSVLDLAGYNSRAKDQKIKDQFFHRFNFQFSVDCRV